MPRLYGAFFSIMKMINISAAVLAGGKSIRMKSDKLFLPVGRSTLLRKTVDLLDEIFPQVMLVSANQMVRSQYRNKKIVCDHYINCGPLAGIHAALTHAETEAVFVFASDMPNLNRIMIETMIELYDEDFDALVPRHPQGIEPLHAIYSVKCLPVIESNLNNQSFSVRDFYPKVRIEYLDLNKTKIHSFFNVNTPADLKEIIG